MHQASRRDILRYFAGSTLAAALPRIVLGGDTAAPRRKPNIIYILADDLGYGDLGCYGQTRIQTPNLDRMAAEGLRFTQCYAGSTVCAPSRCCLMSGYHTGHGHVRGNALVPLGPDDVTVAEVLKAAGYRTGLVGKWGLGEADSVGIPNRKGFDEFFGYLNQTHAHSYYPSFLWRNQEKVSLAGNAHDEKTTYSHGLIAHEGLEFVRRHKNEPFFLYLALTIPHAKMEPPGDEPYSGKSWPRAERARAAMISRMDRDIGRLMDLLRELGIDQETIIFFASDNGPHSEGGSKATFFNSSGPLRGMKRDLYEGGIRVPMIARWPGTIKPGVSEQILASWDFLPTAAAIAGAKAPSGLDGISMLPALLGQPQQSHEFLYWEFHERGFEQAVRMGDWKAVRHGTKAPIELYNLKTDLAETTDVAKEHPEIVRKIEDHLASARTDSREFPIREKKDRKR